MATMVEKRAPSIPDEQRFVIYGIGWEVYETMLELLADRRIRLTYDRGNLELISPSRKHERFAERMGLIVFTLTQVLNQPCELLGSMTWRRKAVDRGLEPDKCFYLQNAVRIADTW